MYAFLRGTVAYKAIDYIALDVQGVGYEVHVPQGVYQKLEPGREATLLTYCYIREEAFIIFGFLKDAEKALFTTLLGVSKVGPKVALAILSTMSVNECGRAVTEHDVDAFTRVPGIGKKVAQRLILEMKSKLGQHPELNAILGEGAAGGGDEGSGDDVYEALMSLGCTPQEAKKAAQYARKQLGDDAPDEECVRVALRSLSKV